MAGSQQGLNQQTMPMFGSEGQGMMPGAGDKLSQLAAQQRALQEQMQKASEGAQGMQEILGDLGQIAAQMGEVAKDLEDKNLGERTRRLQQQIVNRLLDATRSAREEEYSRQRESKSGEQMARRSPPPLMQELEQQRISRDLQKALQEGYTRDYRELIRQYFQALEQTGK